MYIDVNAKACKCNACGHTWIPRSNNPQPERCAKCKSPYWNRTRGVHLESTPKGNTVKAAAGGNSSGIASVDGLGRLDDLE